MRLGQLARKYDIPLQEIIDYLKEETGEKFHANAKLYDAIETQIFKHFDLYPDDPVLEPEEQIEEKEPEQSFDQPTSEPMSPEEDIASVDGELAIHSAPSEDLETSVTSEQELEAQPRPNDDEVIQTDKLLELLENEEATPDLEKVKLIKAPKKELPGLKVLGKVDLPEPKKKAEPEDQKKKPERTRRPQLSEEEREKRRLKAKRKKEAYEARQEKRCKEQEAHRLKELKAKHYQEKLRKAENIRQKKEVSKAEQEQSLEPLPATRKKEPKTLLGKWWRWMNT
ncbi:hypothetical protein [Ekhidna sp.]|uniref:hypothetical protein n=1 Tax=Ekhidna sp. TaxID=2608089 RepID=UPI003C7C9CA6